MYKLTQITKQTPHGIRATEFLDTSYQTQWGKAHRINDTTFGITQAPVTCKDYVVDTFWKSSYGYKPELWTQDIIDQPYIYIVFAEEERKDHFLKMVQEVLNPWEKAQGVNPCIVYEVDVPEFNPSYTVVVEFDKVFLNNATAVSIYYSLLRICTSNTELSFSPTKDSLHSINEYGYYESLRPKYRDVIDDVLKDITPYLYKPEIPYKATGNKNLIWHGQSGLFHILTTILYYKASPPKILVDNSLTYQHIMNKYFAPQNTLSTTVEKSPHPRNPLGQYV